MDASEKLLAAEEIRNLKARYCRAIDRKDAALLRSLFTSEAMADYGDSLTDPNSGEGLDKQAVGGPADPLRGRDAIVESIIPALAGMVTVHHCATGEIELDGPG